MRFIISGTVQGVGFRPSVFRTAAKIGAKGVVYNSGSDVIIETNFDESFILELKKNLPILAKIEKIESEEYEIDPKINDFKIIKSKDGEGIGIPQDVAICDKCLEEMHSKNRRGKYAFTSCTECGPRFTLIESIPYDRERTSMNEFEMCKECEKEYSNQTDRRFHHQTISCPNCGPQYFLKKGSKIITENVVEEFVEIINSDGIGIVKGWGGMHVCTKLKNIDKLRKMYSREQKPFAIMVKNSDAIFKYSNPTDEELKQLLSPYRPIVLVEKNDNVPDSISPGLDTVGIFLPYTGIQHQIFDSLSDDALIMTSANVPGEPMILNDDDVLELPADGYLLHNQKIINRADDSVLKIFNKNTYFIRKSRGHIPSYLSIVGKRDVVALGPHENITSSVYTKNKLYSSQHIGNGESYGVIDYLEESTDSLISMTGCVPSTIAIDLHPSYSNRKYSKKLSEKYGCEIIEIQHHWAHSASLMAEHNLDEIISLSIDGTGYGLDGNAWGGEVLYSNVNNFDRLAHLEYIPLIGGDKALYDIKRLKYSIDKINNIESNFVDEKTSEIFDKMIPNSIKTSSFGRLLDALSYSLNICDIRTYDGEPAMKLEPILKKGKKIEGFESYVKNGEIKTAHLFENISKGKREDVAYSIVNTIVEKMVEVASDNATKKGIKEIGLTGGVSYNLPISNMFENKVKELGFTPIFHNLVPNGDGGISVGQAYIAARRD